MDDGGSVSALESIPKKSWVDKTAFFVLSVTSRAALYVGLLAAL